MNLQLGSTKNMESFATAADHSAYDLIVHPDLHGGYLSFTSQNADNRSLVDLKQKFLMSLHTSRRSVSSLKLINLQCRSLRIPDIISSMRIDRFLDIPLHDHCTTNSNGPRQTLVRISNQLRQINLV
ncbi:uncharacterized protein [Spinacia oleracea]|uniref:Uncharacterized protein isoform X3 n=1 Tax=Spinacia oleracea TaxID=3562 RepID=A0A9R0IRR5_SPIOL|nr:uncharacterized protein LOC110793778 isoform X3 [Spinacia oleracea]